MTTQFQPSYFEIKDGYFKDGVFYCPLYGILRNGKPVEPMGITFAYEYGKASHILMHLQAVLDDKFTLEVISYKPIADYVEAVAEIINRP